MSNHAHKHEHCKHERMKYCAHCDKPYCLDCEQEWNKEHIVYQSWPYYNNWPYSWQVGDTIQTGNKNYGNQNATDGSSLQFCNHGSAA